MQTGATAPIRRLGTHLEDDFAARDELVVGDPVSLRVYDQLWNDGKLERVEEFLAAAGYPNESHAQNDFAFYVADCPCSIDVVMLYDLSRGFSEELGIQKAIAPALFDALNGGNAVARLGVTSFIDKPLPPLGAPGDYVFRIEPGGELTRDRETFLSAVEGLTLGDGGDPPNAQREALMHVGTHAAELGYRTGARRYVIMVTNSARHRPGDCMALGLCTRPNDGNASIDPEEDYPQLPFIQNALFSAHITSLFAVSPDLRDSYQRFAEELVSGANPGAVIELDPAGTNLLDLAASLAECPDLPM